MRKERSRKKKELPQEKCNSAKPKSTEQKLQIGEDVRIAKYSWWKSIKTATAGLVIFGIVATSLDKLKTSDYLVKGVLPGSILLSSDTKIESKDYDLKFPLNMGETSILIWDFAAEDGDEVAIKTNGVVQNGFVITNSPKEFTVPIGEVEILGKKDGAGGGITYAVNFPDLSRSIANSVKINGSNLYRLTYD